MSRITLITLGTACLIAAGGCTTSMNTTTADTPREALGMGSLSVDQKRGLDQGYRETLRRLYESSPGTRELVGKAAGVLVFPNAVAAGFVVGGEVGTGELRVGDRVEGYYRTTSASVGLQAGAQSRALVFLFMTRDSLNRFVDSKGWSVGADASVAVAKIGANGQIESTPSSPTVAFVLTNAGLMANLTLEGTKVTRIN